jgi:hypothetical protein
MRQVSQPGSHGFRIYLTGSNFSVVFGKGGIQQGIRIAQPLVTVGDERALQARIIPAYSAPVRGLNLVCAGYYILHRILPENSALFAKFPLMFVPFIQYAGWPIG